MKNKSSLVYDLHLLKVMIACIFNCILFFITAFESMKLIQDVTGRANNIIKELKSSLTRSDVSRHFSSF